MTQYKTISGAYAKKTYYDGNVQYTDVANYGALNYQPTIGSSDSLLSQRNFFTITTSKGIDVTKKYRANVFKGEYQTQDLLNGSFGNYNNEIKINYDQTDLNKLCYYGSMSEYARVTVENVLTKWVGSIFLQTDDYTIPTVSGATYYSSLDATVFDLNLDIIQNPFGVNISDTTSTVDDTKNFLLNWDKYVIIVDNDSVGVFGSDLNIDNLIVDTNFDNSLGIDIVTGLRLTVSGNPFNIVTPDIEVNDIISTVHVKPNSTEYFKFKEGLVDFEKILLGNETSSEFYSNYVVREVNDDGVAEIKNITLSWKKTDGYNIAYEGVNYEDFVTNLLDITQFYDSYKTDIIYRFLVSENLLTIDMLKGGDYQNSEEAVARFGNTLRVFGTYLDEIKKYIDGISYINTLTYDGKNNLPDQLIKAQAALYGWDVINLYNDIELEEQRKNDVFWKYLTINSPYIWSTKGTRKSVEFLLEAMGIPDGLITFNEHVYVAKDVIDYTSVETLNGVINQDTLSVAIDEDGYPQPLPNNSTRWFQSFGGWYRETGGLNADYEIKSGNNPHIGEYDDGSDYWLQFTELVPNFVKTMVTEDVVTSDSTILYELDYQTVNRFNNKWSYDLKSNVSYVSNENITNTINDCGCVIGATSGNVLKITFGELPDVFTENQEDCSPTYRWLTGSTSCVGFDLYADEYQQISWDGGNTWENTGETQTELVEENSYSCGYTGYTWTDNGLICGYDGIGTTGYSYPGGDIIDISGTTQYRQYIYQYSTDGILWNDVSPIQYQYNVIEVDSFNCGYVNMNNLIIMESNDLDSTASFLVSGDANTNLLIQYFNDDYSVSGYTTYDSSTDFDLDQISLNSDLFGGFTISHIYLYGDITQLVSTTDTSKIIKNISVDNDVINLLSLCGTPGTSRYETPYVGNNDLTGITMSSRTTELEYLYLSANQDLITLDLTEQTKLKVLYISETGIIDMVNLPSSLVELHCVENQLNVNDLSNYINLEIFRGDSSLTGSTTDFNISGCTNLVELRIPSDGLTGLTINGCGSLQLVDISGNNFTSGTTNEIFNQLPDYLSTPTTGYIYHNISPGIDTTIYENKQWEKLSYSDEIYGILVENFDYNQMTWLSIGDRYLIKEDGIYDINFPLNIYSDGDIIEWNGSSWV